MGRHGHDQPPLHHLQQPGTRGAADAAGRRIPRSRILSVLRQQRAADFGTGSTAMKNSMMRVPALVALWMLMAASATSVRAGSSEDDYKAAYAAAEAANNEAGKLRNQWTTAVSALKDAKAAAAAGDFDKAVAESRKSEMLSKAAIFQSNEQKDAWRKMEIR